MSSTEPRRRIVQFIFIVSLLLASWLGMMLVHEFGHVLGAWATGGFVKRIVWHPLAISRTDVSPNPSPHVVVWMGPIVGVTLPLIVAGLTIALRTPIAYLMTLFAGSCLLANGAYLGIESFEGIGDAGDMLRLGSPQWLLVVFAIAATLLGLWLWHSASPKLGFGKSPEPIQRRHVCGTLLVAIAMILAGFVLGSR